MTKRKVDRETVLKVCKVLGVVLVCAIAFAYAVVYIVRQGRFSESYSPDEGHYIAMAQRLLTEGYYSYWGGAPDAYVSPGYPIFLTLCMAVFGTDLQGIDAIKFVQAFLSAGTVFLTFFLGWRLTKKYSVGILGALLLSVNGIYAFYAKRLLTETFFCFTMMLFFAVFVLTWEKDRWWLYLLSGALFCVTIFVRPLLLMTLPVLFIPLLLQCWRQWKDDPKQTRFPWKKLLVPIGLFFLGVLLVGLPWWIRNVVSLGQFVLLATQTNPLYAGLARDPEALGLENPGSLFGNVLLLFQLLFTRPLETLHWMIFESSTSSSCAAWTMWPTLSPSPPWSRTSPCTWACWGRCEGSSPNSCGGLPQPSPCTSWRFSSLCPPPGTGCNTTRCWRCSPAMPWCCCSVAPPTQGFSPAGRTFRCFPVAKRGINQVNLKLD